MNTKASVGIGWAAYTIAFCIGGGIGWYKYYYEPGGRREREKEAEKDQQAREAEEAEYEERVRRERRERVLGR